MAELQQPDSRIDAEAFNMACFRLTRALDELTLCVPEAAPLVRHLLRTAGRVVIDTGAPGADPAAWSGTEEMVLLWLDEALRAHGYQVKPLPEGGRGELPEPSAGWS